MGRKAGSAQLEKEKEIICKNNSEGEKKSSLISDASQQILFSHPLSSVAKRSKPGPGLMLGLVPGLWPRSLLALWLTAGTLLQACPAFPVGPSELCLQSGAESLPASPGPSELTPSENSPAVGGATPGSTGSSRRVESAELVPPSLTHTVAL